MTPVTTLGLPIQVWAGLRFHRSRRSRISERPGATSLQVSITNAKVVTDHTGLFHGLPLVTSGSNRLLSRLNPWLPSHRRTRNSLSLNHVALVSLITVVVST